MNWRGDVTLVTFRDIRLFGGRPSGFKSLVPDPQDGTVEHFLRAPNVPRGFWFHYNYHAMHHL